MPERNTFSWNCIITGFWRAGFVDEAVSLFGSMRENEKDQCSWNAMVSGFAQHGRFDESLEYVAKMHKEDFMLNEYSFGGAFSACAGKMDKIMGMQIHGMVAKSGYSLDVYMGSALVDVYGKCGEVAWARKVFDGMGERNLVSWNSLITCYEQNGPPELALKVFQKMLGFEFEADEVTLASVVSACASLVAIKKGREIHGKCMKFDRFRNDLILSNALVDMYAKCNRVAEARRVFDRMPHRTIVSQTSMINGYAKAASVKMARLMFKEMTERTIVSWNALIAGYTQNGDSEEAIDLFLLLKQESVWPTHYTFGNLLNACANLADLKLGRQAHCHVIKHGFHFQARLEPDIFVGNSLIDMYSKCGSVQDGSLVFKIMVGRDWVSWNAMIVGYAQNGHGLEAINLFKEMLLAGENPDHVTMIGVLCACSHAGFVDEGRQYFSSMRDEYGLEPLKDHYTCMVDLLGRAGHLDEAKDLIISMPMNPDNVIWGSFLGACKVHRNIELGKIAAEKLLDIDPTNSGPYVLLSNMYAELRKWRDVVRIRKLMKQRGVVKQPGCSWIEIQSEVNVFMVKDKRHHRKKEIYSVLQVLTEQMKLAGYVLGGSDIEANEKEIDTELTLENRDYPSVAVGV